MLRSSITFFFIIVLLFSSLSLHVLVLMSLSREIPNELFGFTEEEIYFKT